MPLNITAVKTWIEANIQDLKSHSGIARHFNISVETLRKEFRRKEQKNLHTFITETRIQKAQHLLEHTDLPCHLVCFNIGFEREDTGAKFFKRHIGMTMEEYRKMNNK